LGSEIESVIIEVDGSLNHAEKRASIAGVFSNGTQFFGEVPYSKSTTLVEGRAVLIGLYVAALDPEAQAKRFNVLCDNDSLVSALLEPTGRESRELARLVSAIRSLSSSLPLVEFFNVSRVMVSSAHELARKILNLGA